MVIHSQLRSYNETYCFTLTLYQGKPTVLIYIEPSVEELGDTQLTTLEEILHGVTGLEVLARRGTICCNSSDQIVNTTVICQGYFLRVPNGASIGASTLPNISGSSGFYLYEDKTQRVYGLTAAHNFAIGDPKVKNPATNLSAAPSEANLPCATNTRVFQPSTFDIKQAMRKTSEIIETNKERQLRLSAVPQQYKALQDEIEEAQDSLRPLQVLLDAEDQRLFGTTTNVYELDTTNDPKYTLYHNNVYLLDYTLFAVIPSRVGINAIGDKAIRKAMTTFVDYSDLDHDEEIQKWGRSTYWTYAFRNAVDVDVGHYPRFPGIELAFECALEGKGEPRFVRPGDSCAGIDAGNKGVGIVQGCGFIDARGSKPPTITFISDITTILQRIKEKFHIVLLLLTENKANELFQQSSEIPVDVAQRKSCFTPVNIVHVTSLQSFMPDILTAEVKS